MSDLGPSRARPGDLLCIREADEPALLAIVCSSHVRSDGTGVLVLVQDPYGPGQPPGLDELEGGRPPVTP